MGSLNITINNNNLGATVANTQVFGLVMNGVSESGGYTLNTPVMVTSMNDVATAGITVANNPFAIKQLTEFYNEAPVGTNLWIMLVAVTVTVDTMCLSSNTTTGIVALYNASHGTIDIYGALTDDKSANAASVSITVTNGLNAKVYTAASNAVTTLGNFRTGENPARLIVGGTSYNGTASALTTINSGTTNNNVGIVVGDTLSYDATYTGAAVGLALGTLAAAPLQQKISWVGAGALSNLTAYLNTVSIAPSNGDPATIAGKGFITFKLYPNVSGYFWSGDTTATAQTDDFYFLARGRVIDFAQRLVYGYLVQYVDGTVPALESGLIDPGYAATLESKISGKKGVLTTNMQDAGMITGSSTVVPTTQNIVSTSTLVVQVTVYSVGYSSTINVSLGF